LTWIPGFFINASYKHYNPVSKGIGFMWNLDVRGISASFVTMCNDDRQGALVRKSVVLLFCLLLATPLAFADEKPFSVSVHSVFTSELMDHRIQKLQRILIEELQHPVDYLVDQTICEQLYTIVTLRPDVAAVNAQWVPDLLKTYNYRPLLKMDHFISVYLLSRKEEPVNTVKELAGKRVAALKKSIAEQVLINELAKYPQVASSVSIVDSVHADRSIRMLLQNRADVALMPDFVFALMPENFKNSFHAIRIETRHPSDFIVARKDSNPVLVEKYKRVLTGDIGKLFGVPMSFSEANDKDVERVADILGKFPVAECVTGAK
jgi:hypothetical protein